MFRYLIAVIALLALVGCEKGDGGGPIAVPTEGTPPGGYQGGPPPGGGAPPGGIGTPPGGGAPGAPLGSGNEIRLLKDILKGDPENREALIKLGNLNMDSNRFYEAIDAYQKALKLDPDNVNVRVDMGTCYRRLGMPAKAVQEYRKGVAVDPTHAFAHRNMGIVLAYDLRQFSEAADEFEKYLELTPSDPQTGELRKEIQRLRQQAGAGAP